MIYKKLKLIAKEFLTSAIIALAITIIIKSFFYELFEIPSGSMKPNLNEGDQIIVSKYAYGYGRYFLPIIKINLKNDQRIFASEPKRGDIIVFKSTSKQEEDKFFIKRLIGLPGDTIQLRDNILYINDIAVPKHLIASDKVCTNYGTLCNVYEETLPNGVTYKIWESKEANSMQFPNTTQEYKIPQTHYFFLGDYRNNSFDSRYLNVMGYIPFANLVGRTENILWNKNTLLYDITHQKNEKSLFRRP